MRGPISKLIRAAPLNKGLQGKIVSLLCLVVALMIVEPSSAFGEAGVILDESLNTSVARITGSGHSAVYLSRVCPDSPIKLRLCRPGEEGSVISNYTTLGEDRPYEWNVIPLSLYLYGVEDPRDRPLAGTKKIKHALEERYREKYLSELCATKSCKTSTKAEWREMVGATLSRSLYIFVVETSLQQDQEFIAEFNSLPNVNHFNGVSRNCATFTRRLMNSYFPHAVSANYLDDFGMTSPKAVARSFAHYALRHQESNFYVLHFAQLPGTLKRSTESREGMEQLYRSKKFLIPMLIFADYGVPMVVASYELTGRFDPEHELEHYPSAQATELHHEIHSAQMEKNETATEQLKEAQNQERAKIVGTSEEWKQYRSEFETIRNAAFDEEIAFSRDSLDHLFKRLDKQGDISLDKNGAIWMEFEDGDGKTKIGLSASNLLSPFSDPHLAYAVMLAATDHALKSPKHSRETMADFEKDWALLERARENCVVSAADPATAAAGPSRAILVARK